MNARTSAVRIRNRFAAAHARLRTVAVTGTNGKTSTTSLVAAIAAAQGPSAKLTTLGAEVVHAGVTTKVTGDPSSQFLAVVEEACRRQVDVFALEMTSLALSGGLASRWRPDVAVFTNLTRDHLDYHEDPESYLVAKAQLFLALEKGGTAVLNRDDPASSLLAEIIPDGVRTLWYGTGPGPLDLQIAATAPTASGLQVRFAPGMVGISILDLKLSGEFQAYNAAAAALAMAALGYEADLIVEGLSAVAQIRGRFDVVHRSPLVIVDYAHTPAALSAALRSADRQTAGLVVCVFGCGGERDVGKRALMGACADALADVVWLTDDNPRNESPADIVANVLSGRPSAPEAEWHVCHDRRAAIEQALSGAASGDLVLIAGKGHERSQDGKHGRRPFDDAAIVRSFYDELAHVETP